MDKFGKIRRHHRKERLKIGKIAKFESDLLKAYKDTAPQNSRNFTDVCMVGEGDTNLSPTIQTSVNLRNFAELHLCSLVKTYHFQIRQLYYFWGALFRGVDGCSLTGPHKKLKNTVKRSIFPNILVQFCYWRLCLGIKTVSCRRLQRMARMDMDWGLKKLGQRFKTESISKLSNFNFQWTKTLYQNNLNNIALFFTFFKAFFSRFFF